MHTPRLLTLSLSLLLLAGCAARAGGSGAEGGAIRLTAPEDGALLGTASVEVTGTTSLAVDEVTIAGQQVPVEGGTFEARVDLPEGQQRITASAAGESASVNVTVDSLDPVVIIESPELGSFVQAESLRVQGRVEDATFQNLYLGDELVPVAEDGRFDLDLPVGPGAHRLRFRAEDQVGHVGYGFVAVLLGRFVPPSQTQPESISLSLGADAMQTLAEAIAPELSSEAFQPFLTGANPVVDSWWGDLSVTSELHSMTQVGLTPRDGQLEVAAILYDVEVPFVVDLAVGPTLSGTVYVNAATGIGSATVGVDAGYPVVSMADVDVTLSGLFIDVDGLWDWVDRNVVTSALRGTLTEKIREMIIARVPPMLDDTLAQMPAGYTVTVFDHDLRINGGFDSLGVTRRGLTATLDLGVEGLDPDRSLVARSPGTLVMGDGQAPDTTHDSLGAALSLDILNAALYAAWSTGELTFRKDQPVLQSTGRPFTFAALVLLIPSLRGQAPDDAPVSFIMEPALPIVVQPATDGGLIEVVAPDLRTEVVAVVDGVDQHVFTFSVGARASIDVSLTADEVSVAVSSYSLMADPVDPTEVPRGAPLGPSLDNLLLGLAEPVVAPHLEVGGLLIPSLLGFSVSAPRATLENNYLLFEGTLLHERVE